MWLKRTYSLAEMYLEWQGEAPVRLPLPDRRNGEVVLWNRTLTGQAPQLCIDALLSADLAPDLAKMFDDLEAGVLPRDEPSSVALPYTLSPGATIDADRAIPGGHTVPLKIMPAQFQQFILYRSSELSEVIEGFVTTLRWMQRSAGKLRPYAVVGFAWSRDQTTWRPVPHSHLVRVSMPKGLDNRTRAMSAFRKLWASGEREPLGHELVREAFDIAGTNPRSALLIALSALESGLKEYIQFRVPNSNLILQKLASPPVLTMAQEIIPLIHARLAIKSTELPLTKERKEFLQKWVSQRNLVAHGLKSDIDGDKLIAFLGFVRQFLYTLDTQRGNRWAEPFSLSGTRSDAEHS
jgi:hypothetical protein